MATKSADLAHLWDALDNSRVTAKQVSFRLPVHVAAKINALCDLFPNKTRTEIVGDLLASALEELSANLPQAAGDQVGVDEHGCDVYEDIGHYSRYRELANKHYESLEREMGNKKPARLFTDFGNITVERG